MICAMNIGETINITAVLGTEEGMYPVQTGNQDIDVSYIKIAPDDMEIFILDIDFDKEGIYDISVQFKYGYGDKEYTEVTDRKKIICIYRE